MTLALLVATATMLVWVVLLALRWARVLPVTREIRERGILVAGSISTVTVGGVYPIVWVISSNLQGWAESGRTVFTFAGHLPPGVDEDDFLVFIVVGLLILLGQTMSQTRRYILDVDPQPDQ